VQKNRRKVIPIAGSLNLPDTVGTVSACPRNAPHRFSRVPLFQAVSIRLPTERGNAGIGDLTFDPHPECSGSNA
jgi:hypothetical protein